MASKSSAVDEGVVIDFPEFALALGAALLFLKGIAGDDHRVFSFSQTAAAARFTMAARTAGLDRLRPTLYVLRHSGPSVDKARQRRTLAEIKARGRWSSDKSVQRYQKEGRVGQQFLALPAAVQARARRAPAEALARLPRPCSAPWPAPATVQAATAARSSSRSLAAAARWQQLSEPSGAWSSSGTSSGAQSGTSLSLDRRAF